MASVTLTGLVKEYPNGVRGVDGVDVEIADGEFFALLGPSGCGKTTLLRTLAGLEAATEGRIGIGDRDVTGLQPGERDVAMVFQDYALFPHMTVTDNIAYPLRIQKVGRDERSSRALETAEGLSLAALMERRPAQLSGGQQQRVALARAIACHPQVFLFDEPLSNLDARLRLEARTFLKQLQKSLGVTTVFVTHDQAEALAMADRMAVMDGGRIRQVGTPREVFQRPANTFVANFIGATPMNLLDAQVVDGALDFGGFTLPVPAAGSTPAGGTPARSAPAGATSAVPDAAASWPVAEGDKVVYGVRPEYVRCLPEPAGGTVSGQVTAVENLGVSVLVTAQAGEQSLRAVVPEADEPAVGARVHLAPSAERVLLYRADGDGELIGR